jgi:hypothetical protein
VAKGEISAHLGLCEKKSTLKRNRKRKRRGERKNWSEDEGEREREREKLQAVI